MWKIIAELQSQILSLLQKLEELTERIDNCEKCLYEIRSFCENSHTEIK